jgi:putative transposase
MAVHDPAEALALWRYHLIAVALNPRLSGRERGALVRRIAGDHEDPRGELRSASRNTLDRWIRRYRSDGLAGLRDRPRSDQGSARVDPVLLDEAVRLRLDLPARSAAHISEIIRTRHGVRIAARTLAEQLRRQGPTRRELLRDGRTFGRYEAGAPIERWIGDVLVGPFVPHPRAPGSVRARLFLLVDDHSRLLVHGRWVGNETLRAGQEVLHGAILRRGAPDQLYLDNGAAYAGAELARSCAILGIRLIHSRPYAPQGRGKQERLNRVIRERPARSHPGRHRVDGRAQRAVRRLGRALPQRQDPCRDGRVAAREIQHCQAATRTPMSSGAPSLVGPSQGEPDRRHQLRGQRVRGRPGTRRLHGRAQVPARGPVRDRGLVRRPAGGLRGAAADRPPRPPLWWHADRTPEADPLAEDQAALKVSRRRILATVDRVVPGHGEPFETGRSG